jgi:hypothetical protein
MSKERLQHLLRFYSIFGARPLSGCSGRMNWPKRGVYLFREAGESLDMSVHMLFLAGEHWLTPKSAA